MDAYNPIISVHLGQGGIQLGSALWELLRHEHRIKADAKFETYSKDDDENLGPLAMVNTKIDTLFAECTNGRYRPRAIFADLESSSVEQILNGPSSRLYHPNQLLGGKEDASGNFARGYYSRGREFVGSLMDRVDHMVEASGTVQGFIITRSLGGGTGSGLGALLLQVLQERYPKTVRATFDILPLLDVYDASTEPYNVVLGCQHAIESSDLSFLFGNDTLFRMCQESLDIEFPNFGHYNTLASQIITTLTSALHLDGTANRSLKDLRTNLVPYERLHFPLVSYAPLLPIGKRPSTTSAVQLLRSLLDRNHQTVDTNPLNKNCMAISMMFRGEADLNGMHRIETRLRRLNTVHPTFRLLDWVPQKYSLGVSPFKPRAVEKGAFLTTNLAAAGMINSPAIVDAWDKFLDKARAMESNRAFLHWYENEGLLESELKDAIENLQSLTEEYYEVAKGIDVSRAPSRRSMKCSTFPSAVLRNT